MRRAHVVEHRYPVLVVEQRRPLYVHIKVQVRLGLVLYCPVSNLLKVPTRMRGSDITNHSLPLLAPRPGNRAHVRGALERLSQLLVAVLHVKDVLSPLL